MFDSLSKRLTGTLKKLAGHGKLTEKQINAAMADIEAALIDADVGYKLALKICSSIAARALGAEVNDSLRPGDVVAKIVNDELVRMLTVDKHQQKLNLNSKPPAVMMLLGLQGAGKTTSAAKIARYLKQEQKKNVLLVSTDTVRPAAMEQLAILAASSEVAVDFFTADPAQTALDIATKALAHAQKHLYDVLLVDTAGRRSIDEAMMDEAESMYQKLSPVETLFVADGMLGQVATETVQQFSSRAAISGVVLTKMDGDTRGGAALSISDVTGKPIKFIGTSEKMSGLDYFEPERIAGQILGMGDIVALVRNVQANVDQEKAKRIGEKVSKGNFDLQDFYDQLEQMRNMGGVQQILSKLPGNMKLPEGAGAALEDKNIAKKQAIISSMTMAERANPDLISNSGSRKRRITFGSGVKTMELNVLLKEYAQMRKMIKKIGKGGMLSKMMGKFMADRS